jgi:SmpA / OmlA family
MGARDRYSDERGARRPARRRRRARSGLPAWAWSALAGGAAILVVVVVAVAVRNSRSDPPGNPAPSAGDTAPTGNTVTRAHFDRLRSGMTEAQVRAIMGPPTAVDNYDDEKGKSRQLSWRNGDEYITIAFVNGSSSPPTAVFGGYYLFGRN